MLRFGAAEVDISWCSSILAGERLSQRDWILFWCLFSKHLFNHPTNCHCGGETWSHMLKTLVACAAGWPVYSPASPHCFTALFGHRNRWYLSGASTQKTKEDWGCNSGLLFTLWMANSLWELVHDMGTVTWAPVGCYCGLSDSPVRITVFLQNKVALPPGRVSGGPSQVNNHTPWMDCGEKELFR